MCLLLEKKADVNARDNQVIVFYSIIKWKSEEQSGITETHVNYITLPCMPPNFIFIVKFTLL